MTCDLTVVCAALNEEASLVAWCEQLNADIVAPLHQQAFEIAVIIVDDGSTDGSANLLQKLCAQYSWLQAHQQAHRGKTAALRAGIRMADSEWVFIADADLQHRSADLLRMIQVHREHLGVRQSERASSGLHANATVPRWVIAGFRTQRAVGQWRRWSSTVSNRIGMWLTGDPNADAACALRLLRRNDALQWLQFDGAHRFLTAQAARAGVTPVGVPVIRVPVVELPRQHGQSRYGNGMSRLPEAIRGLLRVLFP